jgi:hypothetical protein
MKKRILARTIVASMVLALLITLCATCVAGAPSNANAANTPKLKVLLVMFDDPQWIAMYRREIMRCGANVTVVSDVVSASPTLLVPNCNEPSLDPRSFDVALVGFIDGQVPSRSLVPILKQAGVTCVAISENPQGNMLLVKAGCGSVVDTDLYEFRTALGQPGMTFAETKRLLNDAQDKISDWTQEALDKAQGLRKQRSEKVK